MKLKQWLIRTALKFNLTRKPKVEVLKLNKEDSLRLWEAIENRPEPNEAPKKAAKDYKNIFGLGDNSKADYEEELEDNVNVRIYRSR